MTNLKGLIILVLVGAFGVILPRTAYAQITTEKQVQDCLSACNPKALREAAQACLTVDALKKCFDENDACKDWSKELGTNVANYCGEFGERMCGCGEKARVPSSGGGSAAPPPPPSDKGGDFKLDGPSRETTLSEEEGCKASGGVWVKETKTECKVEGSKRICQDYSRHYCFTLSHAYDAIEALKKRVAELEKKPAMSLTQKEIDRLRELMGMDFTSGFPEHHDWEAERKKIVTALEAICHLSSKDTAKVKAELKEGEKVTLVAKCEAVRKKIDDNEKRSKEALKKAEEAKKEAGEAKDLAETAVKLTRPALIRVSAVGGLHFLKTPEYNDTGDDFVKFGGVEGQLWHPLGKVVSLSFEGGLGYSGRIYGSHSVMSWLGVGIGTELGHDFLGSVNLFASHFFADDEWSKLNTYGVAPELTWAPGLAKREPGGVVPALTLRVPIGMMRADIQGLGIVQDPVAALYACIGIIGF
jgi:hypothetical protein